jgi:C4-dicarboxylate-specific signal transduction histidine kinase
LISAPILNYPNALKHIIIIILENATDILIERDIQDARISISLLKNEHEYNIQICDNGGGIIVEPIENIFEIYKSYKNTKGLGLGLALAKDLSNFTQTQLTVSNTSEGACFSLNIPIN